MIKAMVFILDVFQPFLPAWQFDNRWKKQSYFHDVTAKSGESFVACLIHWLCWHCMRCVNIEWKLQDNGFFRCFMFTSHDISRLVEKSGYRTTLGLCFDLDRFVLSWSQMMLFLCACIRAFPEPASRISNMSHKRSQKMSTFNAVR